MGRSGGKRAGARHHDASLSHPARYLPPPRSVDVADQTLRQFTRWLAANDVTTVGAITRRNIEDYKVHLVAQPGIHGQPMAKSSQRHRLGTVSYTHLRAHETGRNLVCR